MTFVAEWAARSDVGRVRRSNQDCFGLDQPHHLYVVCDGMGGAAGGEVASRVAVEIFLRVGRTELAARRAAGGESARSSLRRAVAAANREVWQQARMDSSLRGMGSTLVAAHLEGDQIVVIHVGDSRAYLLRGGVARQLTADHSLVAERVRAGAMTQAEADQSSMRSIITRAIGAEADVVPDLVTLAGEAGDVVLLASDGLMRHVGDAELAVLVEAAPSLDAACEQLIQTALERGGSDNITCLLLALRPAV